MDCAAEGRRPAETADGVLRVMEFGGRLGVVAVILAGHAVALALPNPAWLVVSGIVTILAGVYCALNFWRCREAHCVVTAVGWLALGPFSLIEAGLGGSLIGGWEQTVFVAILVIGYLFELGVRVRTGSTALRSPGFRHGSG